MRRYRALAAQQPKQTLKTLRNSSFEVSTERGQAMSTTQTYNFYTLLCLVNATHEGNLLSVNSLLFPMKTKSPLSFLLTILAAASLSPQARAITYTKADNNTALDQAASWTSGVPTSSGTAYWTGATSTTASIGAGITVGGIVADSSGTNTISANGANTLTFSGTGSVTVSNGTFNVQSRVDLGASAQRHLIVNSSMIMTTGNVMGNSAYLYKEGTGTLTITNGYFSALVLTSGTLSTGLITNGGSASGIGQGLATADAFALQFGGGTLLYTGTATSTDRAFRMVGNGTFDASGSGALNWGTGTKVMDYGSGANLNVARTLTLTGTNTGNNTMGTVLIDNGTGKLSLIKSGGGNWILSNANTYTGSTTIDGGVLNIGSTGSINNTSGVSIGAGEFKYNSATALTKNISFSGANGGILSGTGTINTAVDVKAGNTLAPGNSIGTLTFGNGLTIAGTYAAQLGSPGNSDLAAVTGGLTLTGGTLSLANDANASGKGSAGPGAYQLITYTGSRAGTQFAHVSNPMSATLHDEVVYTGDLTSGTVGLNLYALAAASAPGSSKNLGNIRVGGALTGSVSIANSGTGGATYTELLKANVTGNATGFTGLAAGSSSNVNYSLATTTAGAQSGSASVELASTGKGGYADTSLSTTSVSLSGAAYDYAQATYTGAALDFGNVRVGGSATKTLAITNTTKTNATYQDNLTAGATTDNGKVSATGFSELGAGTSGTLSFIAATGTAGSLGSTATLSLNSTATKSGLDGKTLAASGGAVTTTGQVYSGEGVWNHNGGGSYGSLTNMANWATNGGAPGLDSNYAKDDTATFGNGVTAGTVTLDGATPSLKALTFDNASGSYTLAAGSSGHVILNNGTSAATVTGSSGSHTISADVALQSNLNASVASGASLVISGGLSGSDKTLSKSDAGILTLSGTSTYSGATTVSGGKLVVDGSITSAVTVNSGATLGGHGSTGALTVDNGGIIAPGNSPGALTVERATLAAGSIFSLDLTTNGTGTAGVDWDQLKVTGLLDLSGATAGGIHLNLVNYNGFTFDPSTSHTWDSFITFGSVNGYNADRFAIDASAFGGTGTWSVVQASNALDLQYQMVPEPATWAMLVGGLGMLAFGQRLRRRSAQ